MKINSLLKIFPVVILILINPGCDSVEPQTSNPNFVVDGADFKASLRSLANNNTDIKVDYKISYHFDGLPGYVTKLTFFTHGFRCSTNYRQSSACEVGKKYEKEYLYFLPDSLTYLDSLKVIYLIQGCFENVSKDSISYSNFEYTDSVNINIKKGS